MFKSLLDFYTKYLAWGIIVSSFLVAIYDIIYIDLDSMYYMEYSESVACLWSDSPEKLLGLSNLKLSILLVILLLGFCLFLCLVLSTFFEKIKDAAVLFVSSFLIKTWIAIYTTKTLILNLGFIKIFRGMTEAEKQAFVDSLKDNIIQYFDELPLSIQNITSHELFKTSTINYLNSLKEAIPNESVSTDIFSTVGNYLWDNKVTIILGIFGILVLVALNDKINLVNNRLSNEIINREASFNHISTAVEDSRHLGLNNTAAIESTNMVIEQLDKKTNILYTTLIKLHGNTFDIDLSFLNIFILILKKIINKKSK